MSHYRSILITGAGGMLGRAANDLLTSRGHRPACYSRSDLDITDAAALRRAFDQHQPSLILNCAAHTKVDLCEQEKEKADAINGHAVGSLAQLAKAHNAMLVHVSTDFVFDGSLRRPLQPNDPVRPLSAYGQSKLLGEQLLQNAAPAHWLIVRTAWVYGRGGANFPRAIVSAAQAGKPLTVVSDQTGSPTYAPDLAEGILALIDSGAQGIWHLSNAGQTTWDEFARRTLQQFGISAAVTPITSAQWFEKRPGSAIRPTYSVLDTQPFEKQSGKPMRHWQDALADYHRAVAAHGF